MKIKMNSGTSGQAIQIFFKKIGGESNVNELKIPFELMRRPLFATTYTQKLENLLYLA
jgi:hypothetical protein